MDKIKKAHFKDFIKSLKQKTRPPTPITPLKSEPWAAVAVILRWGDAIEVMFVKRRRLKGDPWSGQVALPGGRFERKDGNTLNCVIREVKEEVDLKLYKNNIFGVLDIISPLNKPQLNVVAYLAMLENNADVKSGEEISYIFWAPLNQLQETETQVRIYDGDLKTVKAFCYGQEIIWGMTAKLIKKINRLLNDFYMERL